MAKKHKKICLWPSHIWYFSHVIIFVSNRALDSWSQAFPLRLPCKIFSPSPKSFEIFIVDYRMSSVWPIIVLRYTVWPRILNACLWMDLRSSPTQVSICISAPCPHISHTGEVCIVNLRILHYLETNYIKMVSGSLQLFSTWQIIS